MRVGVLCEFSGTVRDAFTNRGHEAVSCDILPTKKLGPHIQGDCLEQDWSGFDLLVCHPPCTHLAGSGARWWRDKTYEQWLALLFVTLLMDLPAPRVALENPSGVISTRIRPPDQIVYPWQFGDRYQKRICLWLKGLPPLVPTKIVDKGEFVVHGGKRIPKWYSNNKGLRNLTPLGMADAMAEQWGALN